jgi:hypothetical protein
MPPDVTITAEACSSKSSTTVRDVGAPRGTVVGSSLTPRTPSTTPLVVVSPSTRCRIAQVTRSPAACSRCLNGATTPGPVPHVMWKRGTELP